MVWTQERIMEANESANKRLEREANEAMQQIVHTELDHITEKVECSRSDGNDALYSLLVENHNTLYAALRAFNRSEISRKDLRAAMYLARVHFLTQFALL